MQNCKIEIESFLVEQSKNHNSKEKLKKSMKKSASYLSMENLDLDEGDKEDENYDPEKANSHNTSGS